MLTVHSLPELRNPVMVCAFSGWPDAGASASGALAYLAMKWETRKIAEFDPEELFSYTITRPLSSLDAARERQLHWPELGFWTLDLPHATRDIVLVRGPEPDLRWKGCAAAIADLARRLRIEVLITLGCFVAPVSHVGPTPLFARTSHPELAMRLARLGLRDTPYEGPTAFTTAVLHQAADSGVPAVSLWAAMPSYLRGGATPKISATLLSGVEKLAAVPLGLEEMWVAARDLDQRIDEALKQRPDLERLVREMQESAGSEDTEQEQERVETEQPPSAEELPSPEAFLEDLETYLKNLQREKDE